MLFDGRDIKVNIIQRLFEGEGTASAKDAKERLRLMLTIDRTDMSPQLLENLRLDIVAVLKNYIDIDESRIEMSLNRDGYSMALVASIPILQVKRSVTLDRVENNTAGNKTVSRTDSMHNNGARTRRHR